MKQIIALTLILLWNLHKKIIKKKSFEEFEMKKIYEDIFYNW